MGSVLDRFLRYARFSTRSDEACQDRPSSPGQLVLARALAAELLGLGIRDARVGKGGVVYASIPAAPGCEDALPIGFNAHMDTAQEASGEGVKPRVVHYTGGAIALNQSVSIDPQTYPELARYAGQDIVVTDGTTLLGADDKAGIAAIVDAAAELVAHPGIPHAKVCIAFTPDEEIGRGTESFDLAEFGAAYCYTVDGSGLGGLETENFNAATARIVIHGAGVHPGAAKGKMVNAVRLAAEFIALMPAGEAPETTEGYEGYLHPNAIEGDVVTASVKVLIRDHDRASFQRRKAYVQDCIAQLNARYGAGRFECTVRDSYCNMREYLAKAPRVAQLAREAYADCGITPEEQPIRGGTDGAMLSARGLPCPNLFAGGMNCHCIREYLPVPSLEKARDVVLALVRRSAGVASLD